MRLSIVVGMALVVGIAAWVEARESSAPPLAGLRPKQVEPAARAPREPLVMLSADEKTTFEEGDTLTRAFLAGAVKGIIYYNTLNRSAKKNPRFCLPDGSLSLDQFWELATEVLSGAQRQDIIVITGLLQLEKKYPCTEAATASE